MRCSDVCTAPLPLERGPMFTPDAQPVFFLPSTFSHSWDKKDLCEDEDESTNLLFLKTSIIWVFPRDAMSLVSIYTITGEDFTGNFIIPPNLAVISHIFAPRRHHPIVHVSFPEFSLGSCLLHTTRMPIRYVTCSFLFISSRDRFFSR